MSSSPADYLNLTEKRELAEIDADREQLRQSLHALSLRKQRIKARGLHRMEAARVATGPRL